MLSDRFLAVQTVLELYAGPPTGIVGANKLFSMHKILGDDKVYSLNRMLAREPLITEFDACPK
jgi:hypothetical protein